MFANADVTPTTIERDTALAAFGADGTEGRAAALRAAAESGSVDNRKYNSAFVLMQYIGYLRRNPNDAQDTDFQGYDFWLSKLDSFSLPGEDVRDPGTAQSRVQRAEMVRAFLISEEYGKRFRQKLTAACSSPGGGALPGGKSHPSENRCERSNLQVPAKFC